MTTTADELVTDYLARLARASAALPAGEREELLEQISDHITAARARARVTGGQDGPAQVRELLERLGTPGEVAAAASEQSSVPPAADPTSAPALSSPSSPAREVAAAVVMTLAWWAFGLGWLAGLVLTWTSTRWSTRQKLTASLLPVPEILGLVIGHAASRALPLGARLPVFLGIAVVGLAISVVIAVRLVRRASEHHRAVIA